MAGNGSVVDLPYGRQRAKADKRRNDVMAMILKGLSMEQVAVELGITKQAVSGLVADAFAAAPSRAEMAAQLRAIENARLDRAQAAIWDAVEEGDLKAVDSFLRISQRRAKLNGLDAPTEVNLSVHVRAEMEQALAELEDVVLGEVIDSREA